MSELEHHRADHGFGRHGSTGKSIGERLERGVVSPGNEFYRFSHSNATTKRRGKQGEAPRKRLDAESSV